MVGAHEIQCRKPNGVETLFVKIKIHKGRRHQLTLSQYFFFMDFRKFIDMGKRTYISENSCYTLNSSLPQVIILKKLGNHRIVTLLQTVYGNFGTVDIAFIQVIGNLHKGIRCA